MTSKKKKKPKAISSPIVFSIPKQIETTQLQIPPPYEDSGVKYQGYYKKQISATSWELRKQTPVTTWARSFNGTWTENPIKVGIIPGKTTFFLTSLDITCNAVWTINPVYLVLYDDTTNSILQKLQIQIPSNKETGMVTAEWGGPTVQHLTFDPPLQFNKGFYTGITNPGYVEILYFILNGFLEEK